MDDLIASLAFMVIGLVAMICSVAIGVALEKREVWHQFSRVLVPALISLFTAGIGIFLIGLHVLGVF